MAPAAPAIRLPPPTTAAASANCDAPVKASVLSAQACHTLSPEPTAAAPNASPEVPTARPRKMPSRMGLAGGLLPGGPSPGAPLACGPSPGVPLACGLLLCAPPAAGP